MTRDCPACGQAASHSKDCSVVARKRRVARVIAVPLAVIAVIATAVSGESAGSVALSVIAGLVGCAIVGALARPRR